jgi:hypothetical protein
MSISRLSSIVSLTVLLGMGFYASQPQAASISGINGEWAVTLQTEFAIKGFGSTKTKDFGTCRITAATSLNATFLCDGFNTGKGQAYSGSIGLMGRGNNFGWGLDTGSGLNQVQRNMTNWLVAKQMKRGRQLDPANVYYTPYRFRYRKIAVSGKFDQPVAMRGAIKGDVTQLVRGRFVVRAFSYRIAVRFLSKKP